MATHNVTELEKYFHYLLGKTLTIQKAFPLTTKGTIDQNTANRQQEFQKLEAYQQRYSEYITEPDTVSPICQSFLDSFKEESKIRLVAKLPHRVMPCISLYLAINETSNKIIFVKFLNKKGLQEQYPSLNIDGYWQNEQDMISLWHERLLTAYYCAQNTEGCIWLFDYFPSLNLAECWNEIIGCPLATKLILLKQVAEGIRILHRYDWAHRSITFENIMVDFLELESLSVKIADWGVGQEVLNYLYAGGECQQKQLCAPELIRKRLATEELKKIDIWNLGTISHYLLASPQDSQPNDQKAIFVSDELNSVSDSEVDKILTACREENPTKRPNVDMVCNVFANWYSKALYQKCLENSELNRSRLSDDIAYYLDRNYRACIHVVSEKTEGDIYFDGGKIVAASHGKANGKAALDELFADDLVLDSVMTLSSSDVEIPKSDLALGDFKAIPYIAQQIYLNDITRTLKLRFAGFLQEYFSDKSTAKCRVCNSSTSWQNMAYTESFFLLPSDKGKWNILCKGDLLTSWEERRSEAEKAGRFLCSYLAKNIVFLYRQSITEIYLDLNQKTPKILTLFVKPLQTSSQYWVRMSARIQRAYQIILKHPSYLFLNPEGVLDFLTKDGYTFPVQKFSYFPALSLQQLLKIIPVKKIPESYKYFILYMLANALHILHRHHIMHRYLDPSSVLLGLNGKVKLTNLFIAKYEAETQEEDWNEEQTCSMVGEKFCSLSYTSPELLKKGIYQINYKHDIWAWGIIAYELFTGKTPFKEGTQGETIAAIFKGKLDLKGIPEEITPLIEKALVKEEQRTLTTDKIMEDLVPILSKSL